MNSTIRRLPGFAIAIVALGLSASLVFAGQPASVGVSNAASHAGKTVPVRDESTDQQGADQQGADQQGADQQGADQQGADQQGTDTETDSSDATDTPDSSSNCTVDLTQDPSVLLTMNHGSVVCSAAHATTWDTTLYPTKGAWVSHWAKMNHGHDPNRQHGHAGS